MANKKVCDRCGKEITPMSWYATFKGRLMFPSNSLKKDIGLCAEDVELCAECDDSFIDWFNSGKGDRKIKKREEQ